MAFINMVMEMVMVVLVRWVQEVCVAGGQMCIADNVQSVGAGAHSCVCSTARSFGMVSAELAIAAGLAHAWSDQAAH